MAKKEERGIAGAVAGKLVTLVCTALVILAVAGMCCYGLWRIAFKVEHGALAAWALLATVAIPVVGYITYRIGQVENRGVLAGLGLGTGAVISAADKVATVKREVRVKVVEPAQVELPSLPPVNYIGADMSEGEIIDV